MKNLLLTSVVFVAITGAAFAASQSQNSTGSAGPVFPAANSSRSSEPDVAPSGAQYRVRSGKTGVRYVACDRQRAFAGGAIEYGCLSFSKSKGTWSRSIRWFPKYQLLPLTGPLPEAPAVTATR